MAAQVKIKSTTAKRTSIGRKHTPLNKKKRKSWKSYRGQGHP